MSIRAIDSVWKHTRQKKAGAILVLQAIADFVNLEGYAYPSILTLAGKVRMSVRNVQRWLVVLVRAGELKILRGEGPHGVNMYRICLPISGENDADATGAVTVATDVTPAAPTGDVIVTQSVNESSIEPTPIVPRGNDKKFWIKTCFEECFGQKPYPLPSYIIDKLARMIPHLSKAHASSLVEFYQYEPIDSKPPPPPYSSRRQSPERLILDLLRQLKLAIRACPPPLKKEEPPRWREFFRWRYENQEIYFPNSFESLDSGLKEEYRRGFPAFEEATKAGTS